MHHLTLLEGDVLYGLLTSQVKAFDTGCPDAQFSASAAEGDGVPQHIHRCSLRRNGENMPPILARVLFTCTGGGDDDLNKGSFYPMVVATS